MGLRDDMANREGGKENAWSRLRHLGRVAKLAPNAPGDKRGEFSMADLSMFAGAV